MKHFVVAVLTALMPLVAIAGVTSSSSVLPNTTVISSNQHHDVIACRNSITLSKFGCYSNMEVIPVKEFVKRAGYKTLHSVSVSPVYQSATEVLLILEVSNEEDSQ